MASSWMANGMSEAVTIKENVSDAVDNHHSSTAIDLISRDIARMTRLNRAYVALCMIACVTVLGLLLARMFLLK